MTSYGLHGKLGVNHKRTNKMAKITFSRIASKKGGLKDRFQARIYSKVEGKMKAQNVLSVSLASEKLQHDKLVYNKEELNKQGIETSGIYIAYVDALIAYQADLKVHKAKGIVMHDTGLCKAIEPYMAHMAESELEMLLSEAEKLQKLLKARLRIVRAKAKNLEEQQELNLK